MLVKLLVSRVGDNFSQTRGDELEIDLGEACRMIDAQQAVPLGDEAKAEYAEYKNAKRRPTKVKPDPEPKPEPVPENDHDEKLENPPGEAEGEDTPEGPTVDELGLKAQYAKALREHGITTLAELQEADDLTKVKGIGPPSAQEIRDSVAAYLARQ